MLDRYDVFAAVAYGILEVERMVTVGFETSHLAQCTLVEVVVVLAVGWAPAYFRDGKQARPHHVFDMFFSLDTFGPEVSLQTIDQMSSFGSDAADRVVGIDYVERVVAALCLWAERRSVLIHIEIERIARGHDDMMA